ncbi:hypothetical protein DSO57_1011866 [Entomophthora muscae]|uniref:Uncharacterized protein n=1 Tax=Entomophthora muscae TaxID=34485 RepID=A0ACC2S844_9FUNG|nr:hypothetical protein DSO57_1011866 [Entomophthora muscae]
MQALREQLELRNKIDWEREAIQTKSGVIDDFVNPLGVVDEPMDDSKTANVQEHPKQEEWVRANAKKPQSKASHQQRDKGKHTSKPGAPKPKPAQSTPAPSVPFTPTLNIPKPRGRPKKQGNPIPTPKSHMKDGTSQDFTPEEMASFQKDKGVKGSRWNPSNSKAAHTQQDTNTTPKTTDSNSKPHTCELGNQE